jgi:hypothetical protein
MAKLTDEQRRALRLLGRHPTGCAEAMLLAHGFSYDQLGALVFAGLATMQPSITQVGGRTKIVVWVQISDAGQQAIANFPR